MLIRNGPHKYPGANRIFRVDGRQVDLHTGKSHGLELEHGDTVVRHLQDGDVVVLNHRPALQKTGMMSHRVRIMPYSSFRLHPTVISTYNADSAQDEMNV